MKLPRRTDHYITPDEVTRVRVFWEDTQWSVDGVDDQGGYTEACWSFDSINEAKDAVADFVAFHNVNPTAVLPTEPDTVEEGS